MVRSNIVFHLLEFEAPPTNQIAATQKHGWDICVLYPPFLHQLTMQSSLFQPGRLVIFTRSTGERVDATMKGPSEKGDLFAVLEGGQVVTHPCAPFSKIEFSIRSLSPSPEPEVHA